MTFAYALVILSYIVSLLGFYAYISNTLKGKTKPNRVSWLMWSLPQFVFLGTALLLHTNTWGTPSTLLYGLIPLLIFIASFINPKSYWKLNFFDLTCGALSLAFFVMWIFFALPIPFVIIGEVFALIPTLKKAWEYPETETGLIYVASVVSVLLILPSTLSVFQIWYLIIGNGLCALVIYRKSFFGIFSKKK